MTELSSGAASTRCPPAASPVAPACAPDSSLRFRPGDGSAGASGLYPGTSATWEAECAAGRLSRRHCSAKRTLGSHSVNVGGVVRRAGNEPVVAHLIGGGIKEMDQPCLTHLHGVSLVPWPLRHGTGGFQRTDRQRCRVKTFM